jgi:predicted enzyme related to lactoylglutathione lyase
MLTRSGYPAGVPCWVDVVQQDPDATMAFYRDLFDWDIEVRTPEGVPQRYAYARLDGLLVGGLGGPPGDEGPSGWTTYVWVDSADEAAARVEAEGGRVLAAPDDVPRAGRMALCADPFGAVFGLWQAAENRGAELVNAPGSWNFSGLQVADPGAAAAFYGAVLGWASSTLEMGGGQEAWMFRVAGYGEFLAERDPEIRERQAAEQAPEGFADAVATMSPLADGGPARWDVTFAVADADAAFARAAELGARIVTPPFNTDYTRQGVIEDPQGDQLTLSEYRPPSG